MISYRLAYASRGTAGLGTVVSVPRVMVGGMLSPQEAKERGVCRNGLHSREPENRYLQSSGYYGCKPCAYATAKRRRPRYQGYVRKYSLKYAYGITEDTYAELLAAQDGHCGICPAEDGTPAAGRFNRLHVDHDHETGKIRGLLCYRHNTMLGYARDNAAELDAAIAYLRGASS